MKAMKNIIRFIVAGILSLTIVSCDDFFDVKNYQEKPGGIDNPQDLTNALIGSYHALGTYRFYGRDVVALGDMAADISIADASSGHFVAMNTYTFTETDTELRDIWLFGYKVVTGSMNVINAGESFLENGDINDSDVAGVISGVAQAYGLRALVYSKLVEIFSYPYEIGGSNSHFGIPLVYEYVGPAQITPRPTVAATYTQILSDIENAKTYMNMLGSAKASINQFYFNEAAIYALEARVKMTMGNYGEAITAAQNAITIRASNDISNAAYISMWSSIAISDEDIFTIAKSEDDNLSANALNTLYGSYGGALKNTVRAMFGDNDIRRNLITTTNHPGKFDGIASSQATSNIPVFRKSEMYLIIAEANARLTSPNISASQTALLYTAKRDLDITSESDLPSTVAGLLTFISEERIRELFQEGHRWYDARRTGEDIIINNPRVTAANPYDLREFVYPIPQAEINAQGGVPADEQNDWAGVMP